MLLIMKFVDFDFPKIKGFLEKLTEVLLLVVAVSLLLGVLFGPDTAFIGSVYENFATQVMLLKKKEPRRLLLTLHTQYYLEML